MEIIVFGAFGQPHFWQVPCNKGVIDRDQNDFILLEIARGCNQSVSLWLKLTSTEISLEITRHLFPCKPGSLFGSKRSQSIDPNTEKFHVPSDFNIRNFITWIYVERDFCINDNFNQLVEDFFENKRKTVHTQEKRSKKGFTKFGYVSRTFRSTPIHCSSRKSRHSRKLPKRQLQMSRVIS